jgi:hypothetical protein
MLPHVLSPAWSAATVHGPTALNCTALPATLQVAGVVEPNVTG